MTNILQAVGARLAAAVGLASLAMLLFAGGAPAQPLFGTWTPGEPYAASVAGANELERATGRRVSIVNWFQNWGGSDWVGNVQPQMFRAVTDSGRLPLVTWEPRDPRQGPDQPAFSLASIAGGGHDAYIASFARGLRDLGTLVYLRPMHEMNGTWYPWGGGVNGNTAAAYVQAWRRIHHIFAAQGATNVLWVWSPNNFDVSAARPLEAFYPGAAYVDVLAADGYNWGSARPQFGGWQPFKQVFQSVYDRLKALGPQPIWFAEVASAPDGGDKAAWIRDMFARAEGMDRLQALVWFNEFKELDWRANADPRIAAAFTPLPPGVPYPIFADVEADIGDGSARSASSGSAATRSSASRSGSTSAGRGSGADGGGTAGAGAAAGGARMLLRMHTRKRVRQGRLSVVRWRALRAHSVRRWVIYFDGRRVRSVKAGQNGTYRVRRRKMSVGKHRWRVVGRNAAGRRVISGGRSFRVVRATRR